MEDSEFRKTGSKIKEEFRNADAIWKELTQLNQDLSGSDRRVTKRRETSRRVLEILSKDKNRNRLHEKATSIFLKKGHSLATSKRWAVARVWSPVITASFASARFLANERKGKLDPDDVKLPLRLLHLSDNSSSAAEMHQVRAESCGKLDKKCVQQILKFCLEMYDNDVARSMAEMEIMNTLVFLCERVEYVALFRPHRDGELAAIFAIVEDCLDVDDEDSDDNNNNQRNKKKRRHAELPAAAGRIFGSVLESCQELGIALHLYVSDGINLVSRWCEAHLEHSKGNPRELGYLFRGITALMRFHPEQAIKPLSRYGDAILRYAKRAYQHCTAANRHALHGYFIAHMVVAQQAATLRGLMPGDLGYLGDATLTPKEIQLILSIVLTSLTAAQPTLMSKNGVWWTTLDVTIQRHLELCARLLACSQRQFLIDQEWMLLEDPNEFFARVVREFSHDDDDVKRMSSSDATYPSCSPDVVARSPWATHILAPLIHNFPRGRTSTNDTPIPMDIDGSNSQSLQLTQSFSQSLSQGGSSHDNSSLRSWHHPLMDAIMASDCEMSQDALRKTRALLLVVAACAEAFPTGRCWTSTSHKHWFPLNADNIEVDYTIHVNACSPSDFALVVQVVANVLEASGGSNGDQELQMLALLCLIRLTEAHRVLSSMFPRTEMSCVAVAWRKVWSVLFASGMRYSAYTVHAVEGSFGEMVLILLTEMIKGFCADPTAAFLSSASTTRSTFVYRKQGQIWALPAFARGNSGRATKQTFELVYVFLHRLCLSDEARDSLPDSPPSTITNGTESLTANNLSGRRYRLICLCLRALDSFNPVNPDLKQTELLTVVCACLSALVNGKGSWVNTTLESESQNLTWMRSSLTNDLRNKLCFTEVPTAGHSAGREFGNRPRALFDSIWASPLLDPGLSSLQLERFEESTRSDWILREKWKVDQLVTAREVESTHIDYVSPVSAGTLLDFVQHQMTALLQTWNANYGGEDKNESDQIDSQQSNNLTASTSVHCLWLKVLLSLCIVRDSGEASVELSQWEDHFAGVMKRIHSDLSSLCENREEFYATFESTLQILRFLSELSATVTTFEMPASLGKGMSAFDSLCQALLMSFAGKEAGQQQSSQEGGDESQESSSESEPEEVRKSKVTDLLDDSDDDDVVNNKASPKRVISKKKKKKKKGSKRKSMSSRREKESPRKKRKRHPMPPDTVCANLVGSIMITLKPSVERCDDLLDLLLPENNDVDLAQAYHCLNLMSDASVMFHDNAVRQSSFSSANANDDSFRHRSQVSVFCNVLDALRDSAKVASSLHVYGFRHCCKCVRLGESDLRGISLNADESRDLAERLVARADDSSLKMRPYLRCTRLSSTTAAFEAGNDPFRSCMESVFSKELLKRSIQDLSLSVRRESCGAVATALRKIDDRQQVVKSVSSHLPPVVLPSDDKAEKAKQKKLYKKWYQPFDLGSDPHRETQVWEDAKMNLEIGSIDCLSVIAGVDADSSGDIVYDFVKYSARRPELQAACFRACGRIAAMTGYSSAEALLRDQADSLVGRWLENGETLAEIPLLLSSPKLLGLLLRTGHQSRMYSVKKKQRKMDVDGEDEEGSLGVMALQDTATDQFCSKHKSYILPQLILRICKADENVDGDATADAKSRLVNDERIRELSHCLKYKNDEETILSLLQGRLHDIEAICAPMAHGDSAALGTKTTEFVASCLNVSDGEPIKNGSDKPHLTVRRMLELSGMDSSIVFPTPLVNEAFSEAISEFVSKLNPTKEGDILSAANTSLTECFLYARQWLSKATLPKHKEKRWGAASILFNLMFAQVRDHRFNQSQLSFGVNTAVDVVLDPQLGCIHEKALGVLKQALDEILEVANTDGVAPLMAEFSSVCRRLVGSLMKKHEEAQKELLSKIKGRANLKLSRLRHSVGLLGYGSEGDVCDVWGWDRGASKRWDWPDFEDEEFKNFQAEEHRVLVESIKGSFDLLLKLFEKADVLGLGFELFVGAMPPFAVDSNAQKALSAIDKRMCAQTIADDFVKRKQSNVQNAVDLSRSIRFALGELRDRSSWMDEFANHEKGALAEEANVSDLTISQWMLKAELAQLDVKLRRSRVSRNIDLRGDDVYRLIQELSFVCGAPCPRPLRTAASRCLGELNTRVLGNVHNMEEKDWVTTALEDESGSVLLGVQARTIDVLAGYLHSGNSGIAIAAFDTILALQSTQDGEICWHLVDAKTRQDLEPVLLSKRKRPGNSNRLQLSKLKVKSIRAKTGHILEKGDEGRDWCWNKNLWHCGEEWNVSYEDWICDLCVALIECLYRGDSKRRSSRFFSYCQMIAAIAPHFAETIFLAIVIDLLEDQNAVQDSPVSSRHGSVSDDTWIGRGDSVTNKELSSCFQIIMGSSSDPLATALALDTVDLLRRATQAHFVKSPSHKRNSNAYSASNTKRSNKASRGSKGGTDKGKETKKGEHNKGLGALMPWKGVPYGSVLKLGGELVVQACIRVKRYEFAIFYSDLYFESCFAGSSAILQRLALDISEGSARSKLLARVNISGFYDDATACDESDVRERAVSSLKLLGECYLQLHEEDSYQAVTRQFSDLQYSTTEALMNDEDAGFDHVFAPTLDELQRLDSCANLSFQQPASLSLQTVDTIKALGLRNLLQRYVGSMQVPDAISQEELQRLRDQWFESRLCSMNWNQAIMDASGAEPGGRTRNDNLMLGDINDPGFHEAMTIAMSDFARGNLLSSGGVFNEARSKLMSHIDASKHGLHRLVERLQFLNDIENLVHGSETPQSIMERWGFALEETRGADNSNRLRLRTSFDSAEFAPHMRESTLRILRKRPGANGAVDPARLNPQECLEQHLSSFSSWCRKMGFLSVAEASLQRLRGTLQARNNLGEDTDSSLKMVFWHRLEEASLCESRGDFATAIRMTKQTISLLYKEQKQQQESSLSKVDCDCLLVDALVSCGVWLSKNKIEPAASILKQFNEPGANLARAIHKENGSHENGKRFLRAQIALARLTSGLYDSIAARVKSVEWQRAGRSLAERQQELRHCDAMIKEHKSKTPKAKSRAFQELTELMHYQRQVASEIHLAKTARDKTEQSLRIYLCLTVKAFGLALSIAGVGEDSELSRHVYRVVFLWLKTCSEGREDTTVSELMHRSINRIPSFRFVPLTTQLFAQLGQKDRSPFQQTLHALVEKMCLEHPYQCLVQLISICNGKEIGSGVGGRGANVFVENVSLSPRVKAATEISSILRKEQSFVGELLENYQILMSAYIQLANAPTAKLVEDQKTKNIGFAICKQNRLDKLNFGSKCLPCVLTKPPPVRTGRDYGDGKEDPIGGERIGSFHKYFAITDSGLHRPKIVICFGTQGGRFRQLVKGEDEIRQDAVMEQVFTYVNELMSSRGDDRSRGGINSSRDLNLVTYNIIPLSPASGVLEWVENSMTFGDYILDAKTSRGDRIGTHSRYYPGEWGHSRCRQHYALSPPDEKKETFSVICKSWSPSFRFFFVERWGHSLKDWYAAKMRYTKSVACSSIVGHMLGIGDRHTNNILVSQITGEVVHIDFGIVFEQGRILAVPELVPFRLTRNIVDGMGPLGTEGVFTKAAEATATVLRENANALLTILSAVASDPLYRWSVSPVEARRRQHVAEDETTPTKGRGKGRDSSTPQAESTTVERNEAAELVLAKIREKLQGYEDKSEEGQSVEGQVQLLINSARDPNNLCVMFQGWAPWV